MFKKRIFAQKKKDGLNLQNIISTNFENKKKLAHCLTDSMWPFYPIFF